MNSRPLHIVKSLALKPPHYTKQISNTFTTSVNTPTPNPFPILPAHTRNLVLRAPIHSDAPSLASLFQNPLNTQHELFRPTNPTATEYERRIAHWERLRTQGRAAFFVITPRSPASPAQSPSSSHSSPPQPQPGTLQSPIASDSIIGLTALNPIHYDPKLGAKTAGLGIVIDSGYWRRGFGREALVATIEWAFGLGCEEVVMRTAARNAGFRGLAEELGLKGWRVRRENGEEWDWEFKAWREEWEIRMARKGRIRGERVIEGLEC